MAHMGSAQEIKHERMPLTSADITGERLEALKQLIPEAFAEGKIDFDRLRQALGDAVDEGRERYGLSWSGKAESIRAVQLPSTGALRADPENSRGFYSAEHLFIEGDNLEVLKLMQKAYHAQVKMIYIDPPYNTGKEFIYPDNFREGLSEYLRYTGQIGDQGEKTTTNQETSGRYHSRWLSMMYPRLFLARNLMAEDGVLFASIDDHEVHNLRHLLDEVFGPENFVGQVAVQLNPRGRHLDKFLARTHEYVLVYARDIENPDSMRKLPKEGKMLEEYRKEDESGRYRELELRNRNPAFNSQTRPKLHYPIYVNPNNCAVSLEKDSQYSVEVWPRNAAGQESCWTWSQEKVRANFELLSGRQVSDGTWRIFRKDYLIKDGEASGTLPKTIWTDRELNNDQGKKAIQNLFGANVMDFPKSPDFIKSLVKMGSAEGDIVLDFMAGSCTTAQAVLEASRDDDNQRKFIMVQLPERTEEGSEAAKAGYETISALGRDRIRLTMEELSQEAEENLTAQNRGLSLKSFILDSSNFKLWDTDETASDPDVLAEQLRLYADHVQSERAEIDILYELMLKTGMPLTTPVEEKEVEGQTVYSLAEGLLIICLERSLTREVLRGIQALEPKQVICLDQAFGGNDQLKTNTVLEMRSHDIEFRTV
jgi:adenine-specific DNA-methyltransferase